MLSLYTCFVYYHVFTIYANNTFIALLKKNSLMLTKSYIYIDLVCMAGYFGPNCTDKCPYPTYGERCQGYCDCSNTTCNVSTGCETLTTGIFMF